jgi:hypothetical protein
MDTQHRYGHASWTLVLGWTHERAENFALPYLEIFTCLLIINVVTFYHNISAKFRRNETKHVLS